MLIGDNGYSIISLNNISVTWNSNFIILSYLIKLVAPDLKNENNYFPGVYLFMKFRLRRDCYTVVMLSILNNTNVTLNNKEWLLFYLSRPYIGVSPSWSLVFDGSSAIVRIFLLINFITTGVDWFSNGLDFIVSLPFIVEVFVLLSYDCESCLKSDNSYRWVSDPSIGIATSVELNPFMAVGTTRLLSKFTSIRHLPETIHEALPSLEYWILFIGPLNFAA